MRLRWLWLRFITCKQNIVMNTRQISLLYTNSTHVTHTPQGNIFIPIIWEAKSMFFFLFLIFICTELVIHLIVLVKEV